MPEHPDSGSPELQARVEAVEEFVGLADRLFVLGGIEWSAVEADHRLLAINAAFRRQLESIKAAVSLARLDLGHQAVAFVRAALEDVMYLKFFLDLDRARSQRLFSLLGRWDGLRSLLAQRAYLGDERMTKLWYEIEFLDAAETQRSKTREELKELRKEYGWSGGLLPSGEWIAERAGQRPLYDYLHAATSRALHFSAGEIMRRGWGNPAGEVVTDEPEFRHHLAEFALHQLVLLFFETWTIVDDTKAAGITVADNVEAVEVDAVVQRIAALGQVPLVHAAEWNLTPNGPSPMPPRTRVAPPAPTQQSRSSTKPAT
ncbi:DUF5677 domain-containing protein [Micromonospora tulbaghiae]|uniref:DUF5677 domain-containing protein n=1 Tax=Micromonospora tulbaghiae TaxID=479978 RepID=UPI0033F5F586